ncbi:MAG: SPFH domain-containing protein, partial [Alphaproteobacteria bacterium]|nr:SPFH domain-containing protein [Alphaproteobacteria bacterium]
MGLFGRGKSGGLMNVIRCDEEEYMVWKWRPDGQSANSTSRENSIRYGSTLRVKDGEVAVFVYSRADDSIQDYIEGPYDGTIKTANFPVLANIVGMAFGGDSPFQAEVYFINLASNNQLRFAVPYFDVFDPRLPDHGVAMAVRGTITF